MEESERRSFSTVANKFDDSSLSTAKHLLMSFPATKDAVSGVFDIKNKTWTEVPVKRQLSESIVSRIRHKFYTDVCWGFNLTGKTFFLKTNTSEQRQLVQTYFFLTLLCTLSSEQNT